MQNEQFSYFFQDFILQQFKPSEISCYFIIIQHFNMQRLRLLKTISGHQRSEINGLIKNPYNQSQIITIGHDGLMNVWNNETLKCEKVINISTAYQTLLYGSQSGIFIGIGTGDILQYNKQFQEVRKVKIHKDCVTGFLQFQDFYLSCSLDGTLKQLSKTNLKIERSIELENPIYGLYKTPKQNQICLSGNPSYKFDINSFTAIQLDHNYSSFIIFDDKIFGISDQTGLKIINEELDQYIPCQFAVGLNGKLLAFSEGSAGILKWNQQGFQQRFIKMPSLKEGYSLRASVTEDNKIYLASDDGSIIILELVSDSQ